MRFALVFSFRNVKSQKVKKREYKEIKRNEARTGNLIQKTLKTSLKNKEMMKRI